MRALSLSLVALTVATLLAGCDGDAAIVTNPGTSGTPETPIYTTAGDTSWASPLIGTWKWSRDTLLEGVPFSSVYMATFKSSNVFSLNQSMFRAGMKIEDTTMTGKWSTKGDTLITTLGDETDSLVFSIHGNELALDQGESKLLLTKQ
ncbi:MAG: hypothetical protein RL318_2807 [Fibrobacterota bacterium]|jgi:hypothetical protein